MRIGEVAAQAGVSTQTIRLWEKRGLLQSKRTTGGQRLFAPAQSERAMRVAALRRRHGWNPAAIHSALTDERADLAQPIDRERETDRQVYGPRIRAARKARGLTIEVAAARAGISRSKLSSIELGHGGVTPRLLASIADALETNTTAFVPPVDKVGRVIRRGDRPVTTMAGGVHWEELSPPGRGLEPALLLVPSGGSSGGDYTRPDEVWVCVLEGRLDLTVGSDTELLESGDCISLEPNSVWSWRNKDEIEARAIYVERTASTVKLG